MNYNKKSIQQRENKLNTKKNRRRQTIKFLSFRAVIVAFLLIVSIVAGVGIGVLRGLIASAPDVAEIDIGPTGFVTNIVDKDGNVIQQLSDYTSNRIDIEYEDMPENLQNAFVAVEDARFF